MKKIASFLTILSLLILAACGGGGDSEGKSDKIQLQKNPRGQAANAGSSAEESSSPADATEDAMNNKGIGPVDNISLGDIDEGLVAKGEDLFSKNCTACHKVEKRYIGPAVAGVTERRTPEWIMNMMLNPTEMIQKDPIAKQLVGEFNGAVMADQNLSEDEARAILEYFRTL